MIDDGPARGGRLGTGAHECAINDVDEAAEARRRADMCNGRRNGRFEAGPIGAAEDTQVPRRFVPFDNEARMRGRASGIPRVAAKKLTREVEAPAGGVDARALEAIPEVSEGKQ